VSVVPTAPSPASHLFGNPSAFSQSIEKGAPFSKVTELWDFLQLLCAGFVDADRGAALV